MKKLLMTWREYDQAMRRLVKRLSNYEFDSILAIPNGGCIPGVMLYNLLDKPILYHPEFYPYKHPLVVDDISDSGKTLVGVAGILEAQGIPYTTLTIHYKPKSCFKPDLYFKKTSRWVVYPWEHKKRWIGEYNRNRKRSESDTVPDGRRPGPGRVERDTA